MKSLFHLTVILCLLITSILIIGCGKDAHYLPTEALGFLDINVTDAPIDNPEITGAFVTIAGLRLDADTNLLSNKITIDLLAYQDGKRKTLGQFPLKAGSYDSLALILDIQHDAQGIIPGCYIATNDGAKHNISPSADLSKTIIIGGQDIEINEGEITDITIDFDLRKLIKLDRSGQAVKYQLISDEEMQSSIRVLNTIHTGDIQGIINHGHQIGDKILVLGYQSGTFFAASETIGQGVDQILFKNAINSSAIKPDGSFTLAFLPRGKYELVFVSLEDRNLDGNLEYLGILEVKTDHGLPLNDINVEANNTIDLAVHAEGIL